MQPRARAQIKNQVLRAMHVFYFQDTITKSCKFQLTIKAVRFVYINHINEYTYLIV